MIQPTTSETTICPLMSGQIVPTQGQSGGVVTPGHAVLTPSVVVCALEKCAWYDGHEGKCSVLASSSYLRYMSDALLTIGRVIEPPVNSPMAGICDALNEIVNLLKERKR